MLKNKATGYPCVGTNHKRGADGRLEEHPNEYDMLWLQNMKQVLGPHFWLWGIPFSTEMKGQGLFYPRVPEVTESDIRNFKQTQGEMSSLRGEGGKPSDFDIDPQDYINKAVKKYAGNTFILPNTETEEAQENKLAHKTFFIPKSVKDLADND